MKFNEQLNALHKGERNTQLVPLMLRGLGEGMSPQEIVDAIQSVHRDLGDGELRHAMETAQQTKSRDSGRRMTIGELRVARAARAAVESVDDDERDFVPNAVRECEAAGAADIMALSPVPVRGLTANEQAMAYCATVFPDDAHLVFTATEETKFHKRTFDTLRFPSVLFRNLADGGEIPTYAIANQFTGAPDDFDEAIAGDDFDNFRFTGRGSFACTATLATRRLALLEFDEMPLADQARFWVTAIKKNLFRDRLRTLVFSGSKSIHALVRVDAAESDGDMADKWKEERWRLSRLTEFAEDRAYRADRACKDPTRLTRFAGATRVKADGKRVTQRLLWCAVQRVDDIPADGGRRYQPEGYGRNGRFYKCD